jgi:aminoglycoside phosphotransferase (APT) family kinase protein
VRIARLSDLTGHRALTPDARRLSLDDVPNYSLSRGLVDPQALVNNDLVVRDFSSGRNSVFSVESSNGASYLLKQNPHVDRKMTAREADVYELLSSAPSMRNFVPAFHSFDADLQVLVLEFIAGAEDLASYHRHRRRTPIRVAAAVGAVLAGLHGVSPRRPGLASLKARPTALTLHRPHIRLARDCSPACLDLIRIMQSTDGYGSCLDELNTSWSASTLIHRDVRFKNFLLTAPVQTMRHADLKLIDWELACLGDPRWDIGSALGNYLSLWLESIPTTGRATLSQSAQSATCPLPRIQPAIRACWSTYAARRGFGGADAERMLFQTVGFAAARLVQTAYEVAQSATKLTTTGVLHLQLALNMLTRPQEVVAHLYGLG